MRTPSSHVFWICGLSGAGKSTMAAMLAARLRISNIQVLELDGDVLRNGVCQGLGFSNEARAENLRRAAEVARLGLNSGICVIASFITPLECHRQIVRSILGVEKVSIIWADAPIEVCRKRDVKGLYAKAGVGHITNMSGLSAPFEKPTRPDLVLSTALMPATESAGQLIAFALNRLAHGT